MENYVILGNHPERNKTKNKQEKRKIWNELSMGVEFKTTVKWQCGTK